MTTMTFTDGPTTLTWNTEESFASIKFEAPATGVLDLRSGRNKSCATHSEFTALAQIVKEGGSTQHLDIH